MSKYFTSYSDKFMDASGEAPFMLASESLETEAEMGAALKRMETYINEKFATNLVLDRHHVHKVNTGDHRGIDAIDDGRHKSGVYSISGNRTMLPETYEYIMSCWKECTSISMRTQHVYNCSESV